MPMPNRIIKESIHQSERLNSLTDFQFRLWVNLIPYVDDYGRGDARPAIIKGACFPLRDRLTNADIEAALNSLAGAGCVGLYKVDGKPYLYFPRWESHQNVRNRKSKFPAPPEQLQTIESNCEQLRANVPDIQSNPIRIQSESNPNSLSGLSGESADGESAGKQFDHDSKPYKLAEWLDKRIAGRSAHYKRRTEAQLQKWAYTFDLMNRRDEIEWDDMRDVLVFSQEDDFWRDNILSPDKFRKQFVQLEARMQKEAARDG